MILRIAMLFIALGAIALAPAQNYPVRPVRIVTNEPGAGLDFTARVIAQRLTVSLGLASESIGNTPGQFTAVIKADMARQGKLIKDAGIRAD